MKGLVRIDRLDIGYIYAIGFPNDRVKIGRTINPTQRMRAICSQAGYSYDADVNKFHIETAQCSKVEVECHKRASEMSNRLAGEFFDCSFDEAVSLIKSKIVSYTAEQVEEEKRMEEIRADAFVTEMKRIASGHSSTFDELNIGGEFKSEILEHLEPYGGKDFYEAKSMGFGCVAIIFITDHGVYDTWPNGCDYYNSVEGFLANHEATKEDVADDLGIDVCELGQPLDFSVDIRSASHVVKDIGVIGGEL